LKESREEEAIELLKITKPNIEEKEEIYQNSYSWQILNIFAEKGDVEKVSCHWLFV
jgi:hypothetical protein